MTQLITRLYDSKKSAQAVADKLYWKGFPKSALQLVSGTDRDDVQGRLMRAELPEDAAPVYAKSIAEGATLLVIRASYKPLCAARIARETTAQSQTIDVDVTEESRVKDRPETASSVLKEHPRFFTSTPEVQDTARSSLSQQMGMATLSKPRERDSVISGGRFMSKMFWPMPLLRKDRKADSAISGGRHMSKMFWPMPLISNQPRRNSVTPGGGQVFSRVFGMPTIISRKG